MMDYKLVIGVLFLSTLVVLSNGFFFEELSRSKRQADEGPYTPDDGAAGLNCSEFPRNIFRCDCCEVPDDMFGDLRDFFRKCKGELYQYKKGPRGRGPPNGGPRGEGQPDRYKNGRQEENPNEGGEDFGPPDDSTPRYPEGGSDDRGRPPPPPPGDDREGGPGRGGPDCDKKPRGGHRWRHGPSDGCLAECVFREKGWLSSERVNSEQIKKEINNLIDDSWTRVVSSAIDQCANTPAEEGKKCQSGSEEFFMCMGRNTFLSCPNFKESEPQCRQLREFYQRCPNAKPVPLKCHKPPPDGEYNGRQRHHHHHHHHPHHDGENGGRDEGGKDADWERK